MGVRFAGRNLVVLSDLIVNGDPGGTVEK